VESLDLGSFPALSHITLHGMGTPFQQAVENSGTISVRTIRYLLAWNTGTGSLKELESIILAAMPKMPMLRRVEVQLSGLRYALQAAREKNWRRDIEETVPELVKRGMLSVELDC
jgi:hypothetical protein